jgi:hypothetical protein
LIRYHYLFRLGQAHDNDQTASGIMTLVAAILKVGGDP